MAHENSQKEVPSHVEHDDDKHSVVKDEQKDGVLLAAQDGVIDEAYLAREKKLVRKLDMTLMPIIFILYLL